MKHDSTEILKIGTLAKNSGVGVETVRFYERKGLIKKPQRRDSTFRKYKNDDVQRIKFIKRAQDLGFTLREVKELLDLESDTKATCKDLRQKAEIKIEEVKGKINDLKRMMKSLKKFSANCGVKNLSVKECGLLNSLKDDWRC